jgi:amidase
MATTSVQEVIGRDDIVWGFGPDMKPVLEVEPGAVIRFETNDCFTGQIQSEEDLVTGIDFDRVNSATGPVAVKGAEVGDSLVVEILEVEPIEWGVATIIPDMGQLIHKVESPITRRFEVLDGMIHMNERIRFPVRPMVGVVGVATGGEEITNAHAGRHGGNLDDHYNGPGSKLYFPVRQDGGMFAAGDMHANMGDGEICGTGVEIAGEVTVRFDVVKGKSPEWPITELHDAWIVHGTETNGSPTEVTEAIALACEEAQKLLVDEWRMSREDAYIFMSVACDVGIAQACKPSPFSSIARVVIPKIEAIPGPWRF